MNGMAVYAALMRYLGLKKGELILLLWKDIKPNKFTSLHKLCIYRYNDSSNKPVYYSTKGPVEALRDISLPPTLYSILVRWKQSLRESIGSNAVEPQMPIFPSSVFFQTSKNLFLTNAQALKIEAKIKEIINTDESDRVFVLHDSQKTKVVNLDDFKGNKYRTNFEMKALHYGLEPGAIDAVLGRKSNFTYAQHYVDYRDEFIQEIIAVTIERIIADDAYRNQSPALFKTATLSPNDLLPDDNKRTVKQYIFTLDDDSKISLSVNNNYGVIVNVIASKEEENKT